MSAEESPERIDALLADKESVVCLDEMLVDLAGIGSLLAQRDALTAVIKARIAEQEARRMRWKASGRCGDAGCPTCGRTA